MSDFFVILVLKISHLQQQTPDFQNFESLELEHYSLASKLYKKIRIIIK